MPNPPISVETPNLVILSMPESNKDTTNHHEYPN